MDRPPKSLAQASTSYLHNLTQVHLYKHQKNFKKQKIKFRLPMPQINNRQKLQDMTDRHGAANRMKIQPL